jgi:hypothetical protein
MHPSITVELARDRSDTLRREAQEAGRYRRARAVRRAERRLRRRSTTADRRRAGPGR